VHTVHRAAAAAAFVGGTAAWIYLAPDSSHGLLVVAALAALALFHLAAGFAVGRWWAALLPALVTLTVVPADRDREIATWFDYLLFAAVPGAVLLAAGVALRRFRARRAHGRTGRGRRAGRGPWPFVQHGRH
jgi:hypothetical protein